MTDDREDLELQVGWVTAIGPAERPCDKCGAADTPRVDHRAWGWLCETCIAERAARPSTPPAGGIRSALARARRAGTPATLTTTQWQRTVGHFNDRCALCGGPWCFVAHAIPVYLGGGTTAANCLPACTLCNIRKGATDLRCVPSHLFDEGRVVAVIAWLEGTS